ncbi:hypothetical protein D104_12905 [Marinomonas profundimaris]|uniref:Uncharacterized protein n=1 Tax=Marinomonas profundimaris TaxID=1208321 RepID=W1RQI6_9GAMM|nr:hypothetical protein D104_12905 [Marinomonas profundimaris]
MKSGFFLRSFSLFSLAHNHGLALCQPWGCEQSQVIGVKKSANLFIDLNNSHS